MAWISFTKRPVRFWSLITQHNARSSATTAATSAVTVGPPITATADTSADTVVIFATCLIPDRHISRNHPLGACFLYLSA